MMRYTRSARSAPGVRWRHRSFPLPFNLCYADVRVKCRPPSAIPRLAGAPGSVRPIVPFCGTCSRCICGRPHMQSAGAFRRSFNGRTPGSPFRPPLRCSTSAGMQPPRALHRTSMVPWRRGRCAGRRASGSSHGAPRGSTCFSGSIG
jgi:hypothetical protein